MGGGLEDDMKPVIKIKRAYEAPSENDGMRVLVDRLWPRGIKKEDLDVDLWLKEIAPSEMIRKWFSHDPDRWEEFKSHYFEELREKDELLMPVVNAKARTVTLVYGSKNTRINNAVALKEFIEREKYGSKKAA